MIFYHSVTLVPSKIWGDLLADNFKLLCRFTESHLLFLIGNLISYSSQFSFCKLLRFRLELRIGSRFVYLMLVVYEDAREDFTWLCFLIHVLFRSVFLPLFVRILHMLSHTLVFLFEAYISMYLTCFHFILHSDTDFVFLSFGCGALLLIIEC